jgi:predicted RNA-binding protein with PIN domain
VVCAGRFKEILMSVYYIIDGYNLIETHKEYFPGSSRSARDQLVELIKIKRPEGSGRNKIMVIFDGQPGIDSPKIKNIDVRYTSGKEADWHIKKIVEESSNPRQIIVVTDDRAIRHHVSAKGSKVMYTKDFMKKIFPAQKTKSKEAGKKILTPEEIENINEEFLQKKGLK